MLSRVGVKHLRADSGTASRGDAEDWDPNLLDQVSRMADSLSPELLAIFRGLDQHSRLEMTRVMQIDLRADPRLTLASRKFVRENLDLIKSAAGEQLDKMRAIVSQGVAQGLSGGALKKQLVERAGVLESRAELIAVDQTLKANADLNRYRVEALGVKRYRWSSSQDERVRGNPAGKYPNSAQNHYRLNGQTFAYDDPPVTNLKTGERANPGGDVRCRCVAVPVTDDLLFGPEG